MKIVFIGIILLFIWMYSTTKNNTVRQIYTASLAIDGEASNFEASVKYFTVNQRNDMLTLCDTILEVFILYQVYYNNIT